MSANWLRGVFGRGRMYGELAEEIQAHVEEKTEELIAAGMTREDAAAAARRAFGNALRVEERGREVWEWPRIESLLADVRYGLRMLGRSPGFTAAAILILALGIGANTAIFSLINSIMLRALPVRDPQSLVLLRWQANERPHAFGYSWGSCMPGELTRNSGCSFSYPMYEQIRAQQGVFSQVAGFVERATLHVAANGEMAEANGQFVSGNFFPMLGVSAAAGRLIVPGDDAAGAPAVAVLSYHFWQTAFGGNRAIIRKTIEVEDGYATIVGVAAQGFTGLDPGVSRDLWVQFSAQPILAPNQGLDRAANSLWVEIVARTKPGVSVERASSAAGVIFARTAASEKLFKPNDAPRIGLMGLDRGLLSLRKTYSQQLFLIMWAVGIILLIACANIAGLMLARSAARQKEVAVRFALGASRGRVIRQLLTESLMLAMAGGALGILIAYWSAQALADQIGSHSFTPMQLNLRPDAHVLGFTFVVAVVVGVLFGLAPALRGTRVDLAPALKASGANSGAFRGGRRFGLGGTLVIAQVALSIVVLAGAGLLIRTLVNLETAKLGFDAHNVLLFWVAPPWAPHQTEPPKAEIRALDQELRERFAALPGVVSASYSRFALVGDGRANNDFRLPGITANQGLPSEMSAVGQDFFATMHIPLLAGHDFTPTDFDDAAKPEHIIINRMLARSLFGDKGPLGQRILGAMGADTNVEFQVVGVVGDSKNGALRDAIFPTGYIPLTWTRGAFELRTAGDPLALIPAVRTAAKRVNAQVAAGGFQTEADEISGTLNQERLFAWMSSLFGALALALACVGLYGLLAYDVVRRTPEIGLRMALGAQQSDISRFVVGRGIALAAIGTIVGTGIALGVTRALQSLLYGVHAADPATLAGAAVLLTGVAAVACWIPARRAMRVDPMVALRNE